MLALVSDTFLYFYCCGLLSLPYVQRVLVWQLVRDGVAEVITIEIVDLAVLKHLYNFIQRFIVILFHTQAAHKIYSHRLDFKFCIDVFMYILNGNQLS